MLLPAFGSAVLVAWAERLFSVRLGLPSTSLAVPAAYGLVVLVNGVAGVCAAHTRSASLTILASAASFAVMSLGMRVGKSRKKYNVNASSLRGGVAPRPPHRLPLRRAVPSYVRLWRLG